jgi:hypothetical protein
VRIRRAVSALIAVVVSASSASPQSADSRGAVILTLPTSPRALGLADASTAAAPDAWAVFSSPAQLARLKSTSAGLASEAYLVSTQLSSAAIAIPLRRGTFAIGATLLDYGSIREIATTAPGTDGTETGKSYSAQDNAITIGYGAPVGWIEGMTVGGAIELVHSRIADLSASAVAGSLGAGWASRNGWDVALGLQHFGPEMKLGAMWGVMPMIARGAVAAPARRLGSFYLRPLAELRAEVGGGATFAAATEAEWSNASGAAIQLRAGYSLRNQEIDDRWPVALGVGLLLGSWAIDYAPERFTTIDQFTHRFGVRYSRRAPAAR